LHDAANDAAARYPQDILVASSEVADGPQRHGKQERVRVEVLQHAHSSGRAHTPDVQSDGVGAEREVRQQALRAG
jgi:hypothetical protein